MTAKTAQPAISKIEAVDQLHAALARAQAEMKNVAFNCINPHFKNRYADLAAIRDATLPSLTKYGLSMNHKTQLRVDGDHVVLLLIARLTHGESGQYEEAEWPITGQTPQAKGSDMTYGRRYTWSCLTGIASEEDDDAEVAEAGKNVSRETGQRSAHKAHKDKVWQGFEKEMDQIKTPHALKVWGMANAERIHAMPDNWQVHFREEFGRRLTELEEGVKEDGKPANGNGKTVGEEIGDSIPEPGSNG